MARPKRAQNTGSISARPRSDGRFEARLTLPDGSRRSFYGKTWREAEAKLIRARRDLEMGNLPDPGRMTVADLWEEYARVNQETLTPRSMRLRTSHWRCHIAPLVGHVRLSSLTPVHIQRVVSAAREAELANTTVRDIFANLRAILEQVVQWNLIVSNPTDRIKAPRVGESRELPIDHPDQITALMREARTCPLETAIVLGIGLGLRSSEVRGLRWRDLDLAANVVRVRHAMDIVKGEPVFTGLKSRASRRDLPLPAFVAQALRTERRRQAERRLKHGPAWRDLDLVISFSGGPVSNTTLNRHLRLVCEAAQVPPITFHHLRHLCATILLMHDVAPRVAQGVLGHASVSTTMRIYQHVQESMLTEAAVVMGTAMDAYLEG
jgi:integrase